MHPSKSLKTYYGFVTLIALETLFYITSTFRLSEKFNLLNVKGLFGGEIFKVHLADLQ